MNKILIFGIVAVIFNMSCQKRIAKYLSKESIIPIPTQIIVTGSSFNFNKNTTIFVGQEKSLLSIANYLKELLKPSTGFELNIIEGLVKNPENAIVINLTDNKGGGEEGYQIDITEKNVIIEAYKAAGIFRAIQTLRQLLPSKIESSQLQEGPWNIASGSIVDSPTYSYRGAMLDVSRHFFSVEDVKRYIDLLALYKINILHLHLSDDQGWRIEIKSWPELTNIGGSTEVGGGNGGYYTQKQYCDIVFYAEEQFITIIPEIDMPGHTNAALASYAALNPDNRAKQLYTGTKVGFSTLDTDSDITYKFVDDVIGEIAKLTPGPYIHIGGDESHQTKEDDYIKFINKTQTIVNSHGKQMIGWADLVVADLDKTSLAQFWQEKPYNALKAVEKDLKIIMSPATRAYMDMKYDSICNLGLNWAGYIEVDKAYNWSLDQFVEGIKKDNILGIEAPLWTETIETIKDIEFMAFPRIMGYAELGWSNNSLRSWDTYKYRVAKHKERLEYLKINYYKSPLIPWEAE